MISSIKELLQREAQAVLNIPVTEAYEQGRRADSGTSTP